MPAVSPYALKLAVIPTVEASVVVDGVTTHYWEYGDVSSPVQLVMIHGFRGDHHGLEPIVAELGADVHVIIPDLPGFGISDALPSPADINSYAHWLSGFITTLNAESSVILGHSFGSIVVGASLATGLPNKRAILINPIAANALKGPRGVMTRLAVLYYKAAAALPAKSGYALLKNKAIVRVMSETMAKTNDPNLRQWIHEQHDQYFSLFASRDSVLEAFETSVSNDVSQFAPDIHQELMMLVADKDDITALPEQKLLASRIPGTRLEIVEGVGHLVHYEAPDFAARNIRDFLGLKAAS
ncbi:pimeloyl-ACP methyl ester carboxylesterase [Aurantimicrobium minutum]|uniref:alpha/beta fold hydrolase n=1 Tax=Aurantimicrobium minutum TaxID=708131 RepID=UPI002474D364|nr:alpha/beta hydrolase [Aurantimicrobium minutum]MDH6207708.1 pimeloyl-ACP methyl ester carboxylesterase [Aurantimicrobium minutum]MDH6424665.1 pimeloyl-ACP methyl ester carboxylesterase [Aurantimicrobium minutum]